MPTSETKIAALVAAVQHNCDLIDARHARDSGLCTYLLGMREYFRWAVALDLGAVADPQEVGSWIASREQRWEALLDSGGEALVVLPGGIDSYDEARVNELIDEDGFVYGAGIGRFGVPVFFLARKASRIQRGDAEIIVTEQELARGFVATPAVSRGARIVVRLDALRRWLWTRAETALRREPGDAFWRALSAYGQDGPMDEAIERMARGEIESLILHEVGELRVGRLLGADWERMLAQGSDRRSEIVLRAVRDLLADCLITLPALLERGADASLYFWLSNFDGMRRALAPKLLEELAVGPVAGGDDRRKAIAAAQARWTAVAEELLSAWRRGGPGAVVQQTDALAPR